MKQTFLLSALALFVSGMAVNGCQINPFSPPDKSKPGTESSSSSGSSSSGIAGGGGMAGTGGTAGTGGMGGTGGSAGAGGSGGSGGGCVCTNDNNVCTDDVAGSCPNGDMAACHTAKLGATCPAGRCNDTGECVDCLACADAACVDRCNGIACAATTDCKSGHCDQSKCCNIACAGPCTACDRPGTEGTCTRMPTGLQVNGCTGTMICDNNGTCITRTKNPLGALCNTSADCQSGLCRRQYCQSNIGEPCVEDLECGTSLCDPLTKTCKSCMGAGAPACPTGSSCDMTTGFCKVFLGQPADTDAECVTGTVIQFLCSLPSGAACTAHHDCVGRNCVNGVCTAQCSMASQCADGGPCSANGVCGMVAGQYCVINEQCKSGNCSGFPRKCQ